MQPLFRFAPALLLATGLVFAQASKPTFEVATIKVAPPLDAAAVMAGKLHVGAKIDKAVADFGYLSLRELICYAYEIKPYQLSAPDWIGAQRFDIMAKLPEGATKEQVPAMMQTLLEERFKLKIHKDMKELPVYGMIVGKDGPKFKAAEPEAPTAEGERPKEEPVVGAVKQGPDRSASIKMNLPEVGPVNMQINASDPANLSIRMEMGRMTLSRFADSLSAFVDKPVVDMTELKGDYQLALELGMSDLQNVARAAGMALPGMAPGGAAAQQAPVASDPGTNGIFGSIQKLGLKLESRKAPLTQIIVDQVEKNPTEN